MNLIGLCLWLSHSIFIFLELHNIYVLDADLQYRCSLTCSCMCARPSISSRKRRQTRSMSRYNPASIQLRSVLFSQNSICNNRNNSSLNENLFEVKPVLRGAGNAFIWKWIIVHFCLWHYSDQTTPVVHLHLQIHTVNANVILRVQKCILTRMHSSRMRTAHFSGRQGRGVCPGYLPEVVSARGVCRGGVYSGEVSAYGVLPRACLPGGGVQPFLWTEWLTDSCKNITFLQLVGRKSWKFWCGKLSKFLQERWGFCTCI